MKDYWCIPPKGNDRFEAAMEDILDIYEFRTIRKLPVVCMDEKPYQCLSEIRESLPLRPEDDTKIDSEYFCEGTCNIFIFTELLREWHYSNVRKKRTALDWAEEIKYLQTEYYSDHPKIVLVLNSLPHMIGSLCKKYPAQEARSYTKSDWKYIIHPTWKLAENIAENELNVMTRQCLAWRLNSISKDYQELKPWENMRSAGCNHFTPLETCIKLHSLYPKFESTKEVHLSVIITINTIRSVH